MKSNKDKDKDKRVGIIIKNISGFEMKCINYRNSMDIDVEFLESGYIVTNVQWNNFIRGKVKDITESKYGKTRTKEYLTWYQMLRRCFNFQIKNEKPTYKNATCCDEWLLYENFYEWLHSQENFEIWKTLKWSAIDKDILVKGNKTYSPETCCLVPSNVNGLFVKHDALRGEYPIGVSLVHDKYEAHCTNPIRNTIIRIGVYDTVEEAFCSYKKYKEDLIKEIADIEYAKGNITKKCRDAMYLYKVEIND